MRASTSSSASLHANIDSLLASAATPLNLQRARDAFHQRVLKEVNGNPNDNALLLDPNNPTLLKEETQFQKEQWSNLKFTYLELEAKVNFVKCLMQDEPSAVAPGENEALEKSNAAKKAALKALKVDMEKKRDAAIRLAQENSERHANVSKQLGQAQEVQKQIRDMELELARIKATYPAENRMTITQAEEVLDKQTEGMQTLTEQQEAAAAQTEDVRNQVARTAKDIQRLEREITREEARAKEVQMGREAGDTKVDGMCRWLSATMAFYKGLMGIRNVTAVADNELHLEYDVPGPNPLTLKLGFDTLTQELNAAEVEGLDIDIEEAVNLAIANNDAPGLIADVLAVARRSG